MLNLIINKIKGIKKARYQKGVERTAKSIKGKVTVNGPTYINSETTLGTNVHFNGLKIIGNGKVTIGDNFHSGQDCVFISESHNYEGKSIPYDNTYISKPIVIQDNVWLGHGVIVLPGVEIGEGAIIQAGAVVVKSIPPLSIAGGNPAKPFKLRNKEHYFDLKKLGKFH